MIITLIAILILLFIIVRRHKIILNKEEKETFYEGMKNVDKVLKDNNIDYFVVAGSLLGVLRHGEIIPWDDDIDIGIFEKDIEKYNNLHFNSFGYKTKPIDKDDYSCGKVFLGRELYIDVFPFENIDHIYRYKEDRARRLWPNEYFYKDELFPLCRYKFGDISVSGANNPIPYCERAWGKDGWKKGKLKFGNFFKNPLDYVALSFKRYNPNIKIK